MPSRRKMSVTHDAAAHGFSKRHQTAGIVWEGNFPSNVHQAGNYGIGHATTVALRHQDETVFVGHLRLAADGSWVGTIVGFKNPDAIEHAGTEVGDEVAFHGDHVFTATR